MSGPLLIGIAAVGVGWAWIHRNPTPNVGAATSAAGSAADAATTASEVPQGTQGATAVVDAIAASSPAANLGDNAVDGSDGGKVIPVKFGGPDGQPIIVDQSGSKSLGGADPSTLTSSLNTGLPNGDTPPIIQGDTTDIILGAKYGPGGLTGLTNQQVNQTLTDSSVWSNEVY